MKDLLLFYRPTCPYCRKVLNFMQEKNITVPLKNISDEDAFVQELNKIGGKTQVPCLIIEGKALYESDDIINWLDQELS